MRCSSALLLAAFALPARADTIHLKNGNTMEGTVTSETATELVIEIGYGTVNLRKENIESIDRPNRRKKTRGRGSSASEDEIRQFETGEYVPEGAGALNEAFSEVRRLRAHAIATHKREEAGNETLQNAGSDMEALKGQYEDKVRDLAQADAASQNAIIADMNRIKAQAVSVQMSAVNTARTRKESRSAVSEYLAAYERFQQQLDAPEQKAAIKKAQGLDRKYYSWLQDEVEGLEGDFKQDQINAESRGNAVIVDAVINGRYEAKLIVDTGASITVLSGELAAELSRDPKAIIGQTQVTVADGRKVGARIIKLDSLTVGQSEVQNTVAAISAEALPGVDGLLGMTFLNHYVVQVDASSKHLILKDLR